MSSHSSDKAYVQAMAELREARRTIVELRRELERRDELAYFDDGEFTVFLDDEHSSMLQTLFDGQLLVADQNATHELEDALSEFVSNWLDVQWNTLYSDRERPHIVPHGIALSA